MSETTYVFFSGMITMGYGIAGLFFLRFWKRTAESLFAFFAAAFFLLALGQGLVALSGLSREDLGVIYLLRLAAFTLLIIGIVRKNMSGPRK